MESRINIRTDEETKKKAIFVLKAKGKTLSEEVRKMTEQLAKEYDKMQKNNK